MQDKILKIVQNITPFDEMEQNHLSDTIRWIKSGSELFRIKKPDTPPKHLVSYFVLIDSKENKILLVDHIKAQLWVPTGGHVELNENPKITVEREIVEELNIKADFVSEQPFFITQSVTVGLAAGHIDVSLWYVLNGNSNLTLRYDAGEFNGYKWFDYDEVLGTPIDKFDPHLHRFVQKWILIQNK
ncbi:MAG: NUDIX hydrolase [Candidatus Buchananbacteria bacterium]